MDKLKDAICFKELDIINAFTRDLHSLNINWEEISLQTKEYISTIIGKKNNVIEEFLKEFSLSTDEGVAVICLAEALLRIPDQKTAIDLIEDKLQNGNWDRHLGGSESKIVNFSTFGMNYTNKFLQFGKKSSFIVNIIKKLGSPLILAATKKMIAILSQQYIMGNTIKNALKKASSWEKYLISFDILGESARNTQQAENYYNAYIDAINSMPNPTNHRILSKLASDSNMQGVAADVELQKKSNEAIFNSHNISVKMTALHPRLLYRNKDSVFKELLPKLKNLLSLASKKNIVIMFDAEEADRQDLYIEIITELLKDAEFQHYSGIGIVVQAYQKRALSVIEHFATLASFYNKTIPIRLVKGAYWDLEIKTAQELGLDDFPVFTKKLYTDISYIRCAHKILENIDVFYPQFASHNAHTIATVKNIFRDISVDKFEFQRLYGMGESLHNCLIKAGYRSRIYAPIGQYEDLLAYLMRRFLENGANTSFVNKMLDKNLDAEYLSTNPLLLAAKEVLSANDKVIPPKDLYGECRQNSTGYNLGYKNIYSMMKEGVNICNDLQYEANPIIGGSIIQSKDKRISKLKADNTIDIGAVYYCNDKMLQKAVDEAYEYFPIWSSSSVVTRAKIMGDFATLMQENKFELYNLLIKEAGKTIDDAISEVREAIDFALYYSSIAQKLCDVKMQMPGYTGESSTLSWHPKGIFVCISPWNFPLAIFVGQIIAALVCGNTVIAKPSEHTCLIASFAVNLLYKAGLPENALQFIIASGSQVSNCILSDHRISGVCFTGSTNVARAINRTLALRECAIASFIAETGGQNAMVVDSSALLEQAADHIINSAFGSAGQRCSALRVAFIQDEIYDKLIDLLIGYMNELKIANTVEFSTDLGPLISDDSVAEFLLHAKKFQNSKNGRILAVHQQNDAALLNGSFFLPHIIEIDALKYLDSEKFAPILHTIRYKEKDIEDVINQIHNTGFGLTFGIQSRIDTKIQSFANKMRVGNFYANRTTIGAVVGTHPFGGEANSGTGFKAGGPHYLYKFMTERDATINTTAIGGNLELYS